MKAGQVLNKIPADGCQRYDVSECVRPSAGFKSNATGRCTLLVLSRKKNEKLVIGDNITITVVEIRGDKVRIGIEAPKDVTVHREEVYLAIAAEKAAEHLADPDCD